MPTVSGNVALADTAPGTAAGMGTCADEGPALPPQAETNIVRTRRTASQGALRGAIREGYAPGTSGVSDSK
ncbi:hypothetical protein GCM10022415_02510 [Knoellia locipacati]